MALTLANKVKKISSDIGKVEPSKIAKELRRLAADVEGEPVVEESETEEIKNYRNLLTKLKNKESLNKLKIFIDNQRMRKPIRWWLMALDKGEGAGAMSITDLIKDIKQIILRDRPVAPFVKMVLDYGVENGYIALDRLLSKNRAKITLMKDQTV